MLKEKQPPGRLPFGVCAIAGTADIELPQNQQKVVLDGDTLEWTDAEGCCDDPLCCHQRARATSGNTEILEDNDPGVFTGLESKQVFIHNKI